MTIPCRLTILLFSLTLAGCAQAPIDHSEIRTDQDPWERVGSNIAKK